MAFDVAFAVGLTAAFLSALWWSGLLSCFLLNVQCMVFLNAQNTFENLY